MKGIFIRALCVLINRTRIGITSRNACPVQVGIDGHTAIDQISARKRGDLPMGIAWHRLGVSIQMKH